jgi:hypothetical protein
VFSRSDQWILEPLDYSAPERMFRPDREIDDGRKPCGSARSGH